MRALKNFVCAIFTVAMIFGAVSCNSNDDDKGDSKTTPEVKTRYIVQYFRNEDETTNFKSIYSIEKNTEGEKIIQNLEQPYSLVYKIGEITDFNEDSTKKQEYYVLKDVINNNFAQFYLRPEKIKNYIRVKGDGQIGGSTSDKEYNSYCFLNGVNSERISFQVMLRKTTNNVDLRNRYYIYYYHKTGELKVNTEDSTGDDKTTLTTLITKTTENPWDAYNALTSNDHVYEGISLKDTIVLSEETMTVDELVLPKTITTTAPYRDRNAPLQKYATITYTLSETEKDGDGNPLYVPDIEGYLNKYKADYEQLYQQYKTVNP